LSSELAALPKLAWNIFGPNARAVMDRLHIPFRGLAVARPARTNRISFYHQAKVRLDISGLSHIGQIIVVNFDAESAQMTLVTSVDLHGHIANHIQNSP
jgi:hypothetical protein